MKIKSILLAALIAFGFAACNNEDAPQLPNGAEGSVSVKVVPTSKSGTRAITDLTGDGVLTDGLTAESLITYLEVYIFDAATGVADGYDFAEAEEPEAGQPIVGVDEVEGIETHAGAKVVYVVANGKIGEKATLSDLLDVTNTVPATIANGLLMTGNSDEITLVAGENTFGYDEDGDLGNKTPLPIERVNARVAIVGAELNLTDDQKLIFDNLKEVQVAIFNVPEKSKLFGAAESLAMNENFLMGAEWDTSLKTYDENGSVNAAFLDATVEFPFGVDKSPTYYVNENTSAIRVMPDLEANPTATIPVNQQTLIVLRGKPHLGTTPIVSKDLYTDEDGYTYYPVKVNLDGTISGGTATGKILRNTQYNITLNIKGIGNPSIDEVENAFLDVMVAVKPWVVVGQAVTWD